MTTETPGTTRLSDDDLEELWLDFRAEKYPDGASAEAHRIIPMLIASHRTLAAELTRVERENERLRESVEKTHRSATQWMSKGLYTDGLVSVQGQLGYTLAALNGDADATD